MMQSILLATNKTKLSDVNNETKVVENQAKVEVKETEEKGSLSFSEVLSSHIDGSKENPDIKLFAGELLSTASEEEDTELSENLSKEVLLADNADDTEFDIDGLPLPLLDKQTTNETNETDKFNALEGLDKSNTKNELSDSVNPLIKNNTGNDTWLSDVENLPAQEKPVNPIITQIEVAQKTDTQVNEVKMPISPQKIGIMDAGFKNPGKEANKPYEKESKLTFENVLADEPDTSSKELLAKDSALSNVKSDSLIPTLKADFNKSILNHNVEGNAFNTVGVTASSGDRLLNSTTVSTPSPLLQSAALQQPIELQAKHASAMVGERILMMLNQGKQEVTIRLDPAELGSMHIKLQIQQDQLQVAIQTQVGQSREIIEQNLPRLREQLAQQGISLGEATVEQQSGQQQSNAQDADQKNSTNQKSSSLEDVSVEEQSEWLTTQIPLSAQGIDYYA
jgi:flagellar hook-length control protein FliK